MNELQKKVLKQLQTAYANNDCSVNAESLRKKFECSRQGVSRAILTLERKGKIIRQPKYRVVDN